jgi:class 3 adenylate cyclase
MTAQYRAGRQAHALATYQRLRRRLADELGLDPGPAVRELQGLILRHELTVAAEARQPILRRQRRRITVLAAEITLAAEGPLDPEDELAILAPARRSARARILEHGGLVIAEGGDRIGASFGYPSSDRPIEAAVAAALAVAAIGHGDHRVRTSVGVDTGMVVIESGSSDGDSIALAGAPLRSAERWSAMAASGEVLLGPATTDAVAGVVELVPSADGVARAV